MFDRRLLGDIGLAVLLALPTAVLARPYVDVADRNPAAATPQFELASAEHSPLQYRFNFPG